MNRIAKATDTFKELATIYFGTVFIAAWIFSLAEHKSFLDSIWWAFVSALTVGYGDMYPVTLIGRLDAIVLMHIVPLFVIPLIIVRLLNAVVVDQNKFTDAEQEEIKADLKAIKNYLKIKV